LTSWDCFIEAAQDYDVAKPALWGCLVRETKPDAQGRCACWSLVSTRAWTSGVAAFEAYRPHWHIENGAYRELKEGWQLESQRWGRDLAIQQVRVTVTCLDAGGHFGYGPTVVNDVD
jgi:hypothetical protein